MRTFNNTYTVYFGQICGDLVPMSNFGSAKDFKTYLKRNRIKYDGGEGIFIDREDEGYCFIISEKEYPAVADWHHTPLEDYLNTISPGSTTWVEDCESCFAVCGDSVDEIFEVVKSIDNKEITLEYPDNWSTSEARNDANSKIIYGDAPFTWEDDKPRPSQNPNQGLIETL